MLERPLLQSKDVMISQITGNGIIIPTGSLVQQQRRFATAYCEGNPPYASSTIRQWINLIIGH